MMRGGKIDARTQALHARYTGHRAAHLGIDSANTMITFTENRDTDGAFDFGQGPLDRLLCKRRP